MKTYPQSSVPGFLGSWVPALIAAAALHLTPSKLAAADADPFVRLEAGVGTTTRTFRYNQPISDNLREHTVAIAPRVAAEIDAYPFGGFEHPLLVGLGARGTFGAAITRSQFGSGAQLDTTLRDASLSLIWRLEPGPLQVFVEAGYAMLSVDTRPLPPSDPIATPLVGYDNLRFGASARLRVGPIEARGGAAYLHVLSSGYIQDMYFRRSSAMGLDAHAGFALPFARWFEISLTLRYTRIAHDFAPIPFDEFVAGGAADDFVNLHLALGVVR